MIDDNITFKFSKRAAPALRIPETDEDVLEKFAQFNNDAFRESMIGLYEICRLQGDAVLRAYETALRAGAGLPDDEEYIPDMEAAFGIDT